MSANLQESTRVAVEAIAKVRDGELTETEAGDWMSSLLEASGATNDEMFDAGVTFGYMLVALGIEQKKE